MPKATPPPDPIILSFRRRWKKGVESTKESYVAQLRHLHDFLGKPLIEATRSDLEDFIAEREQVSLETAKMAHRAIRAFYKWLHKVEEDIDVNPAAKVKATIPPVPQTYQATEADYEAIMRACRRDRSALGRRDAAMLALYYWTGCRRSDLTYVNFGDIDLDNGVMTINYTKGGEPRLVPLPNDDVIAHLDRWLRSRGNAPGPLFPGRDPGQSIRPNGITQAYNRRRAGLGLDPRCSLHAFRRSGAVRWYRRRGSEAGLMAAYGWKSSVMPKRYRGMADQQLAVEEAKWLLGDERHLRAVE